MAVHGAEPQDLKLREENEYRRDSAWNRLQVQMSHGQTANYNSPRDAHIALQNPIKSGINIMMPNSVGRLQVISRCSYFCCSDLM
jgi:hypothetical protein